MGLKKFMADGKTGVEATSGDRFSFFRLEPPRL